MSSLARPCPARVMHTLHLLERSSAVPPVQSAPIQFALHRNLVFARLFLAACAKEKRIMGRGHVVSLD